MLSLFGPRTAFVHCFTGAVLASTLLGARSLLAQGLPAHQDPYTLLDQLGASLVQAEEDYVDVPERARLLEGALHGMLAALDPHSQYLSPRELDLFEGTTEGEFGGIGVEVRWEPRWLRVLEPMVGGPAARAGVQADDRIIAIDDAIVAEVPTDELFQRLRGAPGSYVELVIQRGQEPMQRHLRVRRELIHLPAVATQLFPRGIAYCRLKQFQRGVHDEFVRGLATLQESNGAPLAGLVLDLRDNPGGLVDEAVAIADEFLPSGVIYSARHRNHTVVVEEATPFGVFERGPVVVLVNANSASASELLAAALQDHQRAILIGARTYGKGSVQSLTNLPGGAALKLTTQRYYTPRGVSLQARGVKPDLHLEEAGSDGELPPAWREEQIPGHLPPGDTPPGATASTLPRTVPAGALTPRRVPMLPPNEGGDEALRLAYEMLTGPPAKQ